MPTTTKAKPTKGRSNAKTVAAKNNALGKPATKASNGVQPRVSASTTRVRRKRVATKRVQSKPSNDSGAVRAPRKPRAAKAPQKVPAELWDTDPYDRDVKLTRSERLTLLVVVVVILAAGFLLGKVL